MSWWKKVEQAIDTAKVVRAIANASDEAVYEQVAREIDRGDLRRGLWVKALAAANGDEQKAKAEYIRLRVAQIRIQVAAVDTIIRADEVKDAPTPAMLPDRTQRPPGCYLLNPWFHPEYFLIFPLKSTTCTPFWLHPAGEKSNERIADQTTVL